MRSFFERHSAIAMRVYVSEKNGVDPEVGRGTIDTDEWLSVNGTKDLLSLARTRITRA
jgi:hypothetical protein